VTDATGGRPQSRQVGLLVLATALPLILAALLMFNSLVVDERESIRKDLTVSAKTLAILVDDEVDAHSAIASTLAHSPSLQANDLQTFWLEAKMALEFVPGARLAVSNPEGQVVLDAPRWCISTPRSRRRFCHYAPRRDASVARSLVGDEVVRRDFAHWPPLGLAVDLSDPVTL
jgi:hypothetical protein